MKNEKTVMLIEGDKESEIRKKIHGCGIDDKEIDACISYMKIFNFFKSSEKSSFGIRFVGSFFVDTNTTIIHFYVFPKYYKGSHSPELSDMSLIMKTIEISGHSFDYISKAEYDEENRNKQIVKTGRYRLAKQIIEDYSSNGIYCSIKKQSVRGNRGRKDWSKSIRKLMPYIDGDDVLYHAPYSVIKTKNNSHILSEIHSCVVKEALDYLRSLNEKLNVTEPEHNKDMLGHLKDYAAVVKKHHHLVFDDRSIKLLRALETWCTEHSRFYRKPVGTVSFELVWEDCIRKVFGNISKKFTFGSPEYRIGTDEKMNPKKQQINNDSIPDVINVFWDKDSCNKRFILFDAKYYLGNLNCTNKKGYKELKSGYEWAEGFPGYKDIAKQYDYYYTLLHEYGLDEGINAFVLPWYDIPGLEHYPDQSNAPEWMRYLGYAYKGDIDTNNNEIFSLLKNKYDISLKSGKNNTQFVSSGKKVLIVQLDPRWLFSTVLNEKETQEERICSVWNYLSPRFD